MSNQLMMNVSENFDLNVLSVKICDLYRTKGFQVTQMNMNNSVRIKFEKGVGGINMLLGMDKGITATCMLQGNNLVVTYSDAAWTGKIIGLAVGWFLCLVPFITAIIGALGQNSLPKEISDDIMMLANSSN